MQVLTSTHRQNTSLTACSSGNVCCFKLESQLGHLHVLLLCMQTRLALLVLLNISRSGCHVVVICRVTVEQILRPTSTHLSVLSLHLFFVCPCLSSFPLLSLSAHQLPVLDYTFPSLLCHSFCSYFLFSTTLFTIPSSRPFCQREAIAAITRNMPEWRDTLLQTERDSPLSLSLSDRSSNAFSVYCCFRRLRVCCSCMRLAPTMRSFASRCVCCLPP